MDVAKMAEKTDLIVISGDLVHEGEIEDYQRVANLLQRQMDNLEIPIEVLLGNHDRTSNFFEGFLKEPKLKKYYFSLEKKDLTLFFLDTSDNGNEAGYLGIDQLNWLRDNLQDEAEKDAVIFMHHPMDGAGLHHMRYSILQESSEFFEVIKNTSVKAVFAGHVHFETSFCRNNILFHTADSAAYHINCDDPHRHLIYDATNYDVIMIEDSEVNVETRSIFMGQDIISTIDVDETDFRDKDIFR